MKLNGQKSDGMSLKSTRDRLEISVKKQSSMHNKMKKIRIGQEVICLEEAETDGRGRDLQAEKEIFARWKIMPRGQKDPKTLEELADCLGLSYQTLWGWSKDQKVLGLIKSGRVSYFSRFTSEVLNSLKRRCLKYGRAQDVKLWLEYVEGWIPKQEQVQDQEINVIFKGINRPKLPPKPEEVQDSRLKPSVSNLLT